MLKPYIMYMIMHCHAFNFYDSYLSFHFCSLSLSVRICWWEWCNSTPCLSSCCLSILFSLSRVTFELVTDWKSISETLPASEELDAAKTKTIILN